MRRVGCGRGVERAESGGSERSVAGERRRSVEGGELGMREREREWREKDEA